MVNMKEILGIAWNIFAPFVGKAMIALVIVLPLGLGIYIIAHKFKNRKK